MIHPSSVHTILYGTGVVLALLVWTIAAGLVSKYNGDFVYSGNFDAANAVLAWGLISWLYYIAALCILLFVSASNFLLAIIVDVSIMAFLWLFGIVSTGCLSDVANWFRYLSRHGVDAGSVGQATLAFAWLLVFLQMGTLIYEVTYTLMHYGSNFYNWRQSFHNLTNTTSVRGNGEKGGVAAAHAPTVPAVQTA